MTAQIPDLSPEASAARRDKLAAAGTEVARLRGALAEALEQRAATAEVLRMISRAAFDLPALLTTLVERAAQLCAAEQGFIFRLEGGRYHLAADFRAPPAFREFQLRNPIRPDRGSLVGRVAIERRSVHIPDVLADPEYTWAESVRLGGFRTMLGVPMLREGEVIGVFALWRPEVRPFGERQIELVATFADQAVIAAENARLFADLKQSLDAQAATSEILQTISASPGDPAPVFNTIAANAARLCEADFVVVLLYDGEGLASAAHTATSPEFGEYFERGYPPTRETATGRAALERKPVQVVDILADPEFVVTTAHRRGGSGPLSPCR